MAKLRKRLRVVSLKAAGYAGKSVVRLPGFFALACTVAGVWVLWGFGWALLSAVPYLLVIDRNV